MAQQALGATGNRLMRRDLAVVAAVLALWCSLLGCSSGEKEPAATPSPDISSPAFDPLSVPDPTPPAVPRVLSDRYAEDYARYFLEELHPYTVRTGFTQPFVEGVSVFDGGCAPCQQVLDEVEERRADGVTVPEYEVVVDELTLVERDDESLAPNVVWVLRADWHFESRVVLDAEGTEIETDQEGSYVDLLQVAASLRGAVINDWAPAS